MKTLKLDSSVFETEVGVRLVKALQGNKHSEYNQAYFIGVSGFKGFFFTSEFVDEWFKEITFNLDDNLKVDWKCFTIADKNKIFQLIIVGRNGFAKGVEFNLTELSKIQGVTIGGEE